MKEILMAEADFKTAKDIEEKNDMLLRECFNFKSILNVYSRFDDKYLVHYLSDGSQIILYTSMGNVYKLNCKSIKEVEVLANTKHRNSSNCFSDQPVFYKDDGNRTGFLSFEGIIKPISDIVPCNRVIQYIQLPNSDNTLMRLRHETYLVSDSQLQYTKIDYLGNKVKQTNFQHNQLLLDGVDLLSTFHDVANNEMSAGTWYTHITDTTNIKSKLIETKVELESIINFWLNRGVYIGVFFTGLILFTGLIYFFGKLLEYLRKKQPKTSVTQNQPKNVIYKDKHVTFDLEEPLEDLKNVYQSKQSLNSLTQHFLRNKT